MRRCAALAAALMLMLSACRKLPDGSSQAEMTVSLTESAPETVTQTETTAALPPTAPEIAALPAGTVLDAASLPPETVDAVFFAEPVSDALFQRINGVSYTENPYITREDLRCLHLLHRTPDGETKTGEMIANQRIADDLIEIFRALYDAAYPIGQIRLVEEYGGDDNLSMADNNSSCFNYRTVPGKTTLSRHALGLAVDINPLYNPYIDGDSIMPENAAPYTDRGADFPMKLTEDDLCCRLFREHGFFWGGFWRNLPDYQHFEMRDP